MTSQANPVRDDNATAGGQGQSNGLAQHVELYHRGFTGTSSDETGLVVVRHSRGDKQKQTPTRKGAYSRSGAEKETGTQVSTTQDDTVPPGWSPIVHLSCRGRTVKQGNGGISSLKMDGLFLDKLFLGWPCMGHPIT